MLSETTIAALKSELRGEVIEPGDAGYDAARRKVYNAMMDRKPRLIVRCADVADVIAAIKFSREHKLPHIRSRWGSQCGWLGRLRRWSCYRPLTDKICPRRSEEAHCAGRRWSAEGEM